MQEEEVVPLVTGGLVGFTVEMREEPVVGKPRHWYRVFSFLQLEMQFGGNLKVFGVPPSPVPRPT